MKRSKFTDLFEEKDQQVGEPEAGHVTPPESIERGQVGVEEHGQSVEEPQISKRGRKPVGKRSNPEWQPFTAYGRTETLMQVEVKLINLGHKNRLSDLLEDLMTDWLKSPRSPRKH